MASEDQGEQEILQIASEVSDVADIVVPRKLVKLQKILDTYPKGSKLQSKVKLNIWKLGLIKVALTSLKQDFGQILNGWNLASKVASIVCQTCAGLEPPGSEKFYKESVPDIVNTLLIVAGKLQAKFIKTSDILEDTKKDLMGYFKSVLDGISLLCSGPEKVALEVIRSPWLLQMLITDDGRTFIQVTELFQSINRIKPGIIGKLDEKLKHQYLDELIYKLSASSQGDIAGAACRSVNTICESYSPTVELLCKRYKGLLSVLMSRKNHGFERDLYRLQQVLEAGSMRQAEMQKKHEAAMLIQAWWRSYYTRKRIKKANVAIATFQRSFRARRREHEEEKEASRMRSELEHMLQMNRRKAMRDLRTRKLHALQILPADEVEKYLQQESHNAAIQIQRHWRGYKIRKDTIEEKRSFVIQTRAAIIIQRMMRPALRLNKSTQAQSQYSMNVMKNHELLIRKWLDRIRAGKREPPAWQRPPGLTDKRRVQLQEKVMEWRENHEIQTKMDDAREDLHYKVQAMIKHFAMKSRTTRKNQQRRELLLSRIAMDAEMLLEAPKLSEATEADVEDFTSHSVPIATKARYNHAQEMRLLRQPWWRKLGDEYQDKLYEEESESWKMF
ncbi:hypothetical protein LSH36_403g03081 [Paralvinella palmiformis]|uniref:IQ calmodulin-binding motif-containing protein 1 n=1 Tax=Paralvinella palmiformis TaxID=53620 RepID=A0AAD9JDN7_9ANNE|nr:hypothetical protein LSH36_403g03081 [Paralvinella palmiformis]